MEIVHHPSWSDYGEEMPTIVSFVDFTLASNRDDAIFHIPGIAGRQLLARHEGFTSADR